MGVSHTLWPHSITRATLACLWFAQGFHRVCTGHQKSKQQSHTCAPVVCTGSVQGLHRTPKIKTSRAILACLWFAQGLHRAQKIKTAEPYLRACGLHRVCTGFAQGTKNQNSRAILACLWFAQGLYRVCTRHQKSKQQSHTCVPVVRTGFAQGLYKAQKIKTAEPYLRACGLHRVSQGTKNQNSRAILACLWFAQGLHRVCTGHKKSKQQSHTCAPVVCTGFVQGTKNQNSRAILE